MVTGMGAKNAVAEIARAFSTNTVLTRFQLDGGFEFEETWYTGPFSEAFGPKK